MAAGELASTLPSAILEAESGSTGEIHIYFSRKWLEKNPKRSAHRIFRRLRLSDVPHQNAVLIYLNPRRRKFALLAGPALEQVTRDQYWKDLAFMLSEDLHSTHFENAVRMAVQTLGITLKKHFPKHG